MMNIRTAVIMGNTSGLVLPLNLIAIPTITDKTVAINNRDPSLPA